MRVTLGLAALLLATPAAVQAQSTEGEQRLACTGDAFRYCSAYIPDREQIHACLLYNRTRISEACRTVVSGGHLPHR